jgi:hypothetical protein
VSAILPEPLPARPLITGVNGVGISPRSVIEADDAARSGKRQFWTTREVKLLQEAYPIGGLPAALQALPGRAAGAIYQKADKLGLRSARHSAKRHVNYAWEWHHDEHIRRKLATPRTGRGVWREIERELGRPRQVVRSRALKLGLLAPREAPLPWTEAEDAVLREAAGKGTRQAQRLLRRAGFQRTETAVTQRMKRVTGSSARQRADGTMSARELAALLGVDGKTVSVWIAEGLLGARRHSDKEWRIGEPAVRRFVIEHPARIHLGKVEAAGGRYWLIDLLGGR